MFTFHTTAALLQRTEVQHFKDGRLNSQTTCTVCRNQCGRRRRKKRENAYQTRCTIHNLTLVWRLFIFHRHSTRVTASMGCDGVLSSSFMAVKSTETIRLIKDGEKGGMGYGGGGRGRLYTYRYTVTTRMTPALRWAAMGAVLMFH